MAKSKGKKPAKGVAGKVAKGYTHPDQTLLMRPEVGTQAQFRKKKPPQTYRYDSSLSPALDWDGQNGARELGEAAIRRVQDGARELGEAVEVLRTSLGSALSDELESPLENALTQVHDGAETLRTLSRPFLTWTGKAERLPFDVPTLPLFVHERLSTKAIVETLVGHKTDRQTDFWELKDVIETSYDLLKHMRSSQIFSVCGLPEIKIHTAKPVSAGAPSRYEMELVGLDTFEPTPMATEHLRGDDVPCWMLDADYNGLCFRASQVFFPRTAAWDSLKKALKAEYDETVWDHLAGARSAPFEAGEQKQVAVKVIDDRGNELLVVKALP